MGQQSGLAGLMLPLAMFAAIFYFMIMRPQKKKQQQHDSMLASISKGSEVITAGGFFGTVREVLDDSYIIELAEGVKVRILKSSISIKKTDDSSVSEPKREKKKKKRLKNGAAADSPVETEMTPEVEVLPAPEAEAAPEVEVLPAPEAETLSAEVEKENNEEKA